ncbi:MAG TPA: SRPBCC family protein [Thermoflexales bacterium]|nr:SRPBCC family protein [Thermoflexales bacterium]HQW36067.1 SRPBCC family protein [Thermoflexales bacterium]
MNHILCAEIALPLPRPKVFEFFADATNLERITPPEMRFVITSPQPITIKQGALIDYSLSLFGVPFGWRTLIAEWQPNDYFVDKQLRGPYALWEHRHSFFDAPDGGTINRDEVTYRLPLSPLGDVAYPLVRAQLGRIFAYRQQAVREILLGKA